MKTFIKFFAGNIFAGIAFAVLAVFAAMAIGTEIYSICCEYTGSMPAYALTSPDQCYMPPSSAHWCGTDFQGRDVFLRAVAGSATAMKVGLTAGLIAAFLGTALGLMAGFFGGKLDDAVVWIYSTFAAMPTLLFMLAFALLVKGDFLAPPLRSAFAALGFLLHAEPGMIAIYLAIGLTAWVSLCRVIRAETMKLKNSQYVLAAKVAGQHPWVILFRHLLPNVFHLVIIYFTLIFASAVMTEVIASYLGVGVQSAPSWGVMISDGQDRLWRGVWWEVAAATGFMFLLVLSLNVLSDHLRDKLDPRSR